ncbi:hypothetical protein DCAR_0415834 [Daucus carota subsp. sativus]|uniref:Myb-like domain-containing protein n=1 Tax=Daucus carota subsp. sativus TaxID=79200 RepID=A0AAF0WXV9_DAUCS|nr:hypothetical protein DCAR_0415834 [Daucus carota subsp. sativus]
MDQGYYHIGLWVLNHLMSATICCKKKVIVGNINLNEVNYPPARQVPDEMPPEVQPGHLQETDSIFNTCEKEYLNKFSSGFKNGDSGTIFVSDSSTTLSPVLKCNSLEKINSESNRKLSFKHESETLKDMNHSELHTSYATKNAEKQVDVSDHLLRGVGSDHMEKDTAFSLGITGEGVSYSSRNVQDDEGRVVGRDIGLGSFNVHESEPSCQRNNVCASQRRSRKPTLRYIDESSEPISKHSKKRRRISTAPSAMKTSGVGSNAIKSRTPVLCSDESFMEAIQVPFDSQVQVPVESQKQVPVDSRVKYHTPDSATETSLDKLEHDFSTPVISKKVKCSRKHKVWTIAEVRDLIDGVSQYGVGKWTEIKKLLFSSSAHRTPVDLKDKWRNLIKASCAEEQRKKEDKKGRNQPWRPLPKSILRRVRELAMIYPCPYNGNSEDLNVCQDSSTSYSSIKTGSSPHIRGKKLHRKIAL